MGKIAYIVHVSVWDRFKIHFLSFVFGLWMTSKMLAKWAWDSHAFTTLNQRDSPPPCLVDSFLGQHKYIKLKGVKFHYVEAGVRSQPLVLLLHGFPDFWLSWRHQIPVLSDHFRVVALDLKGFGDSDKPSGRNMYRIETILEELCFLIGALGANSCTIIGHDIGALIGWCLAQQCPEIVDKLVAISCPHPNEYRKSLTSSCNYKWLNFVQLPYIPEIDALKEDVNIITEYHKHLPQRDMYLDAYKYAFSRTEDWSGALNYYRNFPYIEIVENASINVPVVIINGNKDKFVKLESIVKSTEYCERFYLKIVDGAEHFPHQEKPHVFNDVLLKFLIKKSDHAKGLDRSPSKSIMNSFFGAVSNTVKYGNSVLDTVQKRTQVVGIPLLNTSTPIKANYI